MGSVKITINAKKKLKDGSHPIRIEVIQNRKRAVKTLFSVQLKDWLGDRVKASHPEAAYMNMQISNELYVCREKIIDFDRKGLNYTAKDVLYPFHMSSNLIDCIHEYAATVDYQNARKYKNLADHISSYRHDITIDRVDIAFMDGLKKYFINHEKINSKETVSRYLKFLKTVLNAQFKQGNFSDQKVLSYPTPMGGGHKEKLTKEEFEAILSVDTDRSLSRDCFCFIVYMRGIRIGDCLQLKHIDVKNDRAVIIEQKTGKRQDIKILDPAQAIIDRYKGRSEWYLLPILKMAPSNPKKDLRFQKHIESRVSVINRDLKVIAAQAGVHKKLTTHVARHTFASWADRSGLTSREIQSLLNHSSLGVTEQYLEQLRKSSELDDAVDRIFS